jgi:glucoamylase
VSTANVAELYYRLVAKIIFGGTVPSDSLSAGFFTQAGVDASTTLSEQFDAATGYEKSVSNLSWSYASFLSAIRAR